MTADTKFRPSDRPTQQLSDDRIVFAVHADTLARVPRAELDFVALIKMLWQGKWLIATSTIICTLTALLYALFATQWYRAEVLLAQADNMSTDALLGQFGDLANLAGITVGDGNAAEPLAVLKSRSFTRDFIESQNLLTVLFADDWDAAAGKWKSADPEDWRDWRDAVEYFDSEVRSVRENSRTDLITVAIEWTDPDVAAQWANLLVERLNNRMRERALTEAETNVSYLKGELSAARVLTLQQSIARLLETELQKLMLARGNKEFSFRVIDPAAPPKLPSHPMRLLIVLGGVLGGMMIGIFGAVLQSIIRNRLAMDRVSDST